MGVSIGAVAFKTNVAEFELQNVIHSLFGENYKEQQEACDTRKVECVHIARTTNFIIIFNSELANKFFLSQETVILNKYLSYFGNPEFVFAFEEYDSGNSYGYSLVYNGEIKRQLRTASYETILDFGKPEEAELKWLNGEKQCAETELPQVMLRDLMREKLGFITWNMDEFLLELKYYQKN